MSFQPDSSNQRWPVSLTPSGFGRFCAENQCIQTVVWRRVAWWNELHATAVNEIVFNRETFCEKNGR
jgi:hypothetical protein